MVNQPLNGPQDGVVRGHQFPQVLGHRGHVVRHQCLEVQVKFFLHYLKILTYASKVVPTNDHSHIRLNFWAFSQKLDLLKKQETRFFSKTRFLDPT